MISLVTSNLSNLWKTRQFRITLQLIWASLIIIFISYAIFSNRETIVSIQWTRDRLALIGMAVVCTLLRRLAGGLRWVWLIYLLGQNQILSVRQGLRIYFVSNLATYIPGTYWFIVGRAAMSQKHGITAFQTGVSTLVEHFLLILSGALLSIFGLQLVTDLIGIPVDSLFWIVLIAIGGFVAIHPRSIKLIINAMARILKMQQVEVKLSYGMMLLQLLWSIVIWLFGSISLWLLAKAFIPSIDISYLGIFSAIFSLSWLIGFFTPFAPSGIGIREGVMVAAFTALGISSGIIALLAVLSRVLILIEDLFWAAVSMWL